MSIATTPRVESAWAVVDGHQRVMVLFSGRDAAEAARDWQARGYRVEQVDLG